MIHELHDELSDAFYKEPEIIEQEKTISEGDYGCENDYDSWKAEVIISIPPEMLEASNQMLQDYLEYHFAQGCSCAHDCCGHVFTSWMEHTRLDDGTYRLVIAYGRNV
jgi:hypothetical protein